MISLPGIPDSRFRNLMSAETGCKNFVEDLPCSHSFCKKCVEPWLSKHRECPFKCGIYSPSDMIPNRVMCESSVVINDPKQVRDLKIAAEVGKQHQQLAALYEQSCKRVRSYTT